MADNADVIKFEDYLFRAILNGNKTSTIRKGYKTYGLGDVVLESVSGKKVWAKIISISFKYFKDLDYNDANSEGYSKPEILKDVLVDIYPDIKDNDVVTVINFEIKKEQ